MEGSGMQAGMLPNLASGMLGLEMPLHPHLSQHHNPNSSLHQQQYPHHHHHQNQQMVTFATHDTNHHSQSPHCVKQTTYPYATPKGKQPQQQLGLSDDDEPGFTADDCSGDGRRRISPWQRVKWTDNMVRLLIMVVFYVGDDACSEGNDQPGGNKKKSGSMLQKKGKWKSVSKAMMEKGFYVSPQQCEDKFNDLNKRYKRVNDILGKGTACRVVENQSLLDTMDQLSSKMKEEARKLLNSKHLFFREMCAYHNSGGIATTGAHHSPEVALEFNRNQNQQPQHQQHCLHSSDGAQTTNSKNRMVRGVMHEEEEEEDEDEDNEDDGDENDEEEEEDSEEEMHEVGGSGKCTDEHSAGHEDGDINNKFSSKKRQRGSSSTISPLMQQLNCEIMSVLQDGTKNPWEQRQWIRSRSMQLEEQQVSYQFQAFELEKQQIKWAKFSWQKEREMERMKLNNERARLENERMVLILRQKELDLLDLHRQQRASNKIPDLSAKIVRLED